MKARRPVCAQVCDCLLGKVEGEAILSNKHLEINGRRELFSPSLPETESRSRGSSSLTSSPPHSSPCLCACVCVYIYIYTVQTRTSWMASADFFFFVKKFQQPTLGCTNWRFSNLCKTTLTLNLQKRSFSFAGIISECSQKMT